VSATKVVDAGFAEPSLPRSNGALSFDAPWQARAMAMTVLAVEHTGREWEDFRRQLIAAISSDPSRPYWDSWVAALDCLLGEAGLI